MQDPLLQIPQTVKLVRVKDKWKLKVATSASSPRSRSNNDIVMPITEPPRPSQTITMAIFTMPMIECDFDGYQLPDSYCAAAGGLNSFYVRWLDSVGVRAIPMQWDAPFGSQIALARSVNGILFPGGDLDHFKDVLETYFKHAKRIYDFVVEENAKGDRIVLWGTCQGFQLLCACAAGTLDVIEPGFEGTSTKMMPVDVTAYQPKSRILGNPKFVTDHVLSSFKNEESTLNFHRFGVTPSSFETNPGLRDAFIPVSTNVDAKGRAFVSIMEHKTAAIYGVQFHPEWPPYDYSDARINRSIATICVSSYLARFLQRELQANHHHFPEAKVIEKLTVHRCPVTYEGFGWEMYWVGTVARTEENGVTKMARLEGSSVPVKTTEPEHEKELALCFRGLLVGATIALLLI